MTSTNGNGHGINGAKSASLTNYCAFVDQRGVERIGHLDDASQTIQPLAFASGTYLSDLYQVIRIGEERIIASGEPVSRSSVRILPPINGRDVLCVGKNYAEHAKEFHNSGFDSSDKTDQPTHPVIFSKRFSSIISDGDEIYAHPKFTKTIDYEGELGVIIGKQGFRIGENEAMDHVWGYTIINDLTARERQRDHKQFYIGKSPDTFCPMVSRLTGPSSFTGLIFTGPNCRSSTQTGQSPTSANTCKRRASSERHHRRLDLQHPIPLEDHV
jgi:2-keto-4-pentenoate hydratase/2-oxohepta-3-ene-1,7-dioic acid hydratase in catechol pathway